VCHLLSSGLAIFVHFHDALQLIDRAGTATTASNSITLAGLLCALLRPMSKTLSLEAA
jgi:hypothetical protein